MIEKLKASILVVDSDQRIVSVAKQALFRKGFKNVYVAGSGAEASAKLKLVASPPGTTTTLMKAPDVVILDATLPDADGFSLCRHIKDSFPDTIVLMMLGYGLDNIELRLVEGRADDFLSKHLTSPAELVSRIEFLLDRSNQIQGAALEGTGMDDYRLPHIGDQIDRYYVLDSLGWGKYSVIYKALERDSNEVFAIKLLTKHASEIKDVIDRFVEEINIMSRVKHPNIVRFHNMGQHNGCPYVVMDFINGLNLEKYLISKGRPDLKTVFAVGLEMASALECLHKNGILHRDVKLGNIMVVGESGKAVLTDFGISSVINEEIKNDRDEAIKGTPIYMAPEIFEGAEATARSDIYSFGVTLYHFISGVPPFAGGDMMELFNKHKKELPKSLRLLCPDIPKDLDSLVTECCMAKRPEDRPASMAEVSNKLAAARDGMREVGVALSKEQTVLLVDDEPNVLNALRRLLMNEPYEVLCAPGGQEALEVLGHRKIELVISDARMPGMSGVELVKRISERWPDTARVMLSGYADIESILAAINDGHVYKFMAKPWMDEEVKLTIRRCLEQHALTARNRELTDIVSQQNRELKALNSDLETLVDERTKELRDASGRLAKFFCGVVETLSGIMEMHVPELRGHGKRVAYFSRRLARDLDLPPTQINDIEIAAFLHDIGKIALSGKLAGEFRQSEQTLLLERHPSIGARIFAEIPDFGDIANIVKCHHENIDGSGYPAGLKGEEIPLGARLIAVTDTFDFLMSPGDNQVVPKRHQIEDKLIAMAGSVLDAKLVEVFLTHTLNDSDMDYYGNNIPIRMLRPGMILTCDLLDAKGEVYLKAETTLTSEIIKNLANNHDLVALHPRVAITSKPSEWHLPREKSSEPQAFDIGLRMLHHLSDSKLIALEAKD